MMSEMTGPTHEEVLAAIDKAREDGRVARDERLVIYSLRDEHCDDLRATAERHVPLDHRPGDWCSGCTVQGVDTRVLRAWPCPDYQQVIDRLTAWDILRARADAEEGK
jgi:hypothetical protein